VRAASSRASPARTCSPRSSAPSTGRHSCACPPDRAPADAIERAARDRAAADLAILTRWTRERPGALAPIALDEDRRSLRAIIRGLAAGAPVSRRLAGTVATPALPASLLETLAAAADLAELARLLELHGHPLAGALALPPPAATPGAPRTAIDPFELELRLAHAFVARARPADAAMRVYLAQLVDAENAAAALLVSVRDGQPDPARLFLAGGERLGRAPFVAACRGAPSQARDHLAAALAGTPLAGAVYAAEPGAFEEAVLDWQLATQRRQRRRDPLGFAAVLEHVLRRRREALRLRRTGWRAALGAAS